MLQNFYQFREQPFGVNPDPRFLFMGRTHREAFASLLYRIDMESGFLAMIAQPGMGKTTLLFHLLRRLQPTARTAFIFQTQCTSNELLRHLLSEFECDTDITDPVQISRELKRMMLAEANVGRRCVLVIDEAQNLGPEVLETIRLLSNFETPRRKLLNIVLSGQSELGEMLGRPELQQLRQRLSCIVRMDRFTPGETALYIAHRLAVAGYPGRASELFNLPALTKIAQLSHGVPRVINNLCFNALSLGYALGHHQIKLDVIEEVANDLGLSGEVFPVSPDSSDVSTDALSEVSAACCQSEHSGMSGMDTAAGSTEVPALENEIPVQLHSQLQDPEEDQISPMTGSPEQISADEGSVDVHETVLHRAARTLLGRSALCALVLLLTPAVDLPAVDLAANLGLSADPVKAAPAPERAALISSAKLPGPFENPSYVHRTYASPVHAAASPLRSRELLRRRHLVSRLRQDSGTHVDLGLASFTSQPLLKAQSLAPMTIPARRSAPSSAIAGPVFPPVTSNPRIIQPPVRVSSYVPPKPIWQPTPQYPSPTYGYHSGDVQLVLYISSTGNVYDVGVLKGDQILASAAESAVRDWRYKPALFNGNPVGSKVFVTVQFQRQ